MSIELTPTAADFKGSSGPAELHHHHRNFSKGEPVADYSQWESTLVRWGIPQQYAQQYAQKFVEHHVYDEATLAKLETSELKELNISPGHRAIIMENARRSRKGPATFHSVCGNLGIQVHGMYDELTSLKLWQGVVGEFSAAAIYVFILDAIIVSSGLLVQSANKQDDSLNVANLPGDRYLSISVGAGFAFAIAVYTFTPIGAGHVTPAISLAYLFTSAISPLRWALYICAQLVGSMIAVGFVKTLSYGNFDSAQGGIQIAQPGYGAGPSLGIEVLTTYILVMTALSFNDKRRARGSWEFGPLALGFVVLAVHLIALPINGASMNPARSFATSAVYHNWDNQWTYWLGPGLGATIAVLWYELFLREKTAF